MVDDIREEIDRLRRQNNDYYVKELTKGSITPEFQDPSKLWKELKNRNKVSIGVMLFSVGVTLFCVFYYSETLGFSPIIFWFLGVQYGNSNEDKDETDDKIRKLGYYFKRRKKIEELENRDCQDKK